MPDRSGALAMINRNQSNFTGVINFLVDGGYSGENFANAVKNLVGAEVQVSQRNQVAKFCFIPQRWIVERSFGWLEKYRSLWKNCDRKLTTSAPMVVLAFTGILLKRI